MEKKLRPYSIPGACNPQLAHTALASKPAIRLQLPCNMTIEAANENSCGARMKHPSVKMQVEEIGYDVAAFSIANDAAVKLQKVFEALRVV